MTDTFIIQIQGGVLLRVGEGIPVRTLWGDGCYGRDFAGNGGQDHRPPGVGLSFRIYSSIDQSDEFGKENFVEITPGISEGVIPRSGSYVSMPISSSLAPISSSACSSLSSSSSIGLSRAAPYASADAKGRLKRLSYLLIARFRMSGRWARCYEIMIRVAAATAPVFLMSAASFN